MKSNKNNIDFDEVIGFENTTDLSKSDQDLVLEYRRDLYEKRLAKDKMQDYLTEFRFSLMKYVDNENPVDVISLGQFLNRLLKQMDIKKGAFAEYIDISPRNLNKYFNGDRKFSIEHALKLEKLFDVNAEILLEIQLKNDIIAAKRVQKNKFDNYNLNDLLTM